MSTSPPQSTNKWLALALLATAQFVVVLDASIVNVALPSIGKDLDFSSENLSWVVNSYTLVFGGFLLLGGRLADLLGRRRLFIAGLLLFALASLVGGFAQSEMKKNIENNDMPISSPTTFEPRRLRSRKIENGTSGDGERCSTTEKMARRISDAAPRPSVCVEVQPALLASTSA